MSFDLTRRRLLAAGAAAATLPMLGHEEAQAQAAWPTKPIRIVVPYAVGGRTDVTARVYGEYLSKQVGQPVLVENKAGGNGVVGAVEVKRAAPDGYTLQCTISQALIGNRVLIKDLPYDPDKDFVMFSAVNGEGFPFVASRKCGATTLKEFIDYARKADKVSMGSYAVGSPPHMTAIELNKQYGLKIEPIQYRGEAPMWADLMNQTIDAAIGSYGAALPSLQGGHGKAIAAVGKPIKGLAEVPTMQQQGAQSKLFGLTGFTGFLAPAGTPVPILRKLSDVMVAGGKDAKVQEALASFGWYPALSMEDAQKLYKEETPVWLDLIASLGLKPE
jgi:tripartite-type tricarboxylate transporter receptor subunit TctC